MHLLSFQQRYICHKMAFLVMVNIMLECFKFKNPWHLLVRPSISPLSMGTFRCQQLSILLGTRLSPVENFSLSFRLALENFLLVAGLLPAPAPCLQAGTRTQETECICIPSASPVGTGSSSQSSAPSYSLRTVPLTFPISSSHLVNRENFRDTISQGTDRQQMAHSTGNGRRWFYL